MSKGFISKISILMASVFVSFSVMADQAAYISQDDAARAEALLEDLKSVKEFCAPCKDTSAKLLSIAKLESADTGYEGNWEIKINGQGVDLAYLYYPEDSKWRNVAIALGLDVVDVPEFID